MSGPLSIRTRLNRLVGGALVGACLAVTACVWWIVGHEMDELMDHELYESAELIHNVLRESPALPNSADTPGHKAYEAHLVWQLVRLSDLTILSRSHRAPATPLAILPDGPDTQYSADGDWRVVRMPMKDNPELVVFVAQSQQERLEARQETAQYAFAGALAVGLLTIVLLQFSLRRELAPISQLSREVQRYDPMDASTRLSPAGRAEFEPVVNSVLDLGERLSRRMHVERAFNAHAAHALRTPVAGLQVQLAVALNEAPPALRPRLERAAAATDRLANVMRALLTVFRAGNQPSMAQLSLAELRDALSTSGLAVQAGDAWVHADGDLMTAVLQNLADNAVRHGAKTMQLTLGTDPKDGAFLAVTDDGEGVRAQSLAQIQEDLDQQRYAGSDTGARLGLGLVLADLVMRAHGGKLRLAGRPCGFEARLCWPGAAELADTSGLLTLPGEPV